MELAWNFATLLTFATLICGLLLIFDKLWLKPRRLLMGHESRSWLIEQAYAFFPVLLIVLLLRSFVVEPFRIPSGSMKPGLLEGDFILVNKYTYGLRSPIFQLKFLPIGLPKRGDVLVFHAPFDISEDVIKRVIGLPGDTIAYKDKTLYINGQPQSQSYVDIDYDFVEPGGQSWTVHRHTEQLDEQVIDIFVRPQYKGREQSEIVVPEGHYFVMGDNRDNSNDGRFWGFVPESHIVGRAFMVWMSWDGEHNSIRTERLGQSIK